MFFESYSFDFNDKENLSILDFKEEKNNEMTIFNEEDEEDEDIKSQKELMYNIMQDNLAQMKNTLLILRRRLISEKDICNSKRGKKPKYLLNNIKSDDCNKNSQENKSLIGEKRGKEKKKYIHSKFSYDNMFYKTKVIYHNFLVDLTNDIYNNYNSKPLKNIYIKRISGKITQNHTITFNKEIGDLTLKDFLSKEISSYYSNSSHNSNKENIELLYTEEEKYKKLILLLNYKYKDFYQQFYIKDNCIKLIEDNFNFNLKRRKNKFVTFKESVDKLTKKESKEFIIKFIDFAKCKFIQFLEGNRVNLKIIYETKLNDLFINNNN